MPHFAKRLTPLIISVAILAALAAAPRPSAAAATPASDDTPKYALSGRAEDLSKVVLARTPMGPVTALDVLMFDAMTSRGLARIPIEHWLTPRALAAEADIPAMRRGVLDLVATEAVSRRAGNWQPADDMLRVLSFGAADAAWVQQMVQPQIKVADADINSYYLAHSDKYLHQQPIQVRYIFRAVANTSDTVAMRAATDFLSNLATQIRAGGITFEAAARANSQTDSARQGGLLPPFTRGTYFTAFENEAYQLDTPAQIGGTFNGPGGVYILQLEKKWPVHNIAIEEVSTQIRDTLRYEHVAAYYPYLLGQMQEKHFTRNATGSWDYLNVDAPVAQVGKASLSRNDLMRFYGNPNDVNFSLRGDIIARAAVDWMAGEAVMGDLEQHGMAQHQWIQRARTLAAIKLRAEHVFANEVPVASFNTVEGSHATLAAHPEFTSRMRSARLIRFTIAPKITPKTAPDHVRLAKSRSETIDNYLGEGYLAAEPQPISLNERIALLPPNDETAFKEALRGLTLANDQMPWEDLTITVADADWQPVMPGTLWWELLAGIGRGQVSPTQVVGDSRVRYLVVFQRPLDLTPFEKQPLVLKSLAFDAESEAIVLRAVGDLNRDGAVQYDF